MSNAYVSLQIHFHLACPSPLRPVCVCVCVCVHMAGECMSSSLFAIENGSSLTECQSACLLYIRWHTHFNPINTCHVSHRPCVSVIHKLKQPVRVFVCVCVWGVGVPSVFL